MIDELGACARGPLACRRAIPFRTINRRGSPGYEPGLQRHHLLPRQLLSKNCFGRFFSELGRSRVGFDDFRANGLLLPSREEASVRLGMPLHRGPHRNYNAMVIERVGQIESAWSRLSGANWDEALEEALFRLGLLQSALRRRLLAERKRLILNKNDPLGAGFDFSELDAMAEQLWNATN